MTGPTHSKRAVSFTTSRFTAQIYESYRLERHDVMKPGDEPEDIVFRRFEGN